MKAVEALQLARDLPKRQTESALNICLETIKDASLSGSTEATINTQHNQLEICGEALVKLGYRVSRKSDTTLFVDWSAK